MVGQAVAANVDIMNAAMNDGRLGAAKVASAANPLRLRLRCDWPCLDGARLHVKPASAREGPERKCADAEAENAVVWMRTKGCGH